MKPEAVPTFATHHFVLGTCGWFEALSPDMASAQIRLADLPDGRADGEYEGYEFREFEKFVEIQVWTDDVLDLVVGP